MNETKKQDRAPVARTPVPDAMYEPPYLAAAIAAGLVWALYVITLAPTTAFWDTSEYIATAHIMGIPHPPGNPTFVVLARAWELLLAPFGLVHGRADQPVQRHHGRPGPRLLVPGLPPDRHVLHAGPAAAPGRGRPSPSSSAPPRSPSGASPTSTRRSTPSPSSASRSSAGSPSTGATTWAGKDDNLILLMIFILALSVGNHLMSFLAAPAIARFILLVEPDAAQLEALRVRRRCCGAGAVRSTSSCRSAHRSGRSSTRRTRARGRRSWTRWRGVSTTSRPSSPTRPTRPCRAAPP
jgi:hypothetical protein